VSQAYTSISLAEFSNFVGLDENEAAILAVQQLGRVSFDIKQQFLITSRIIIWARSFL
jgi:hypothetical protein